MAGITVDVVTDCDKFFDGLHFVEIENHFVMSPNIVSKITDKILNPFQTGKKVAPPPTPMLEFCKRQTIPMEITTPNNNRMVLYHKKDYEALQGFVKASGQSGSFIVCVESKEDREKAVKLFGNHNAVEIVSTQVCGTDQFTFVIMTAILKRVLREAGFLD